ncbi:hypothetical protein QBC34DRAFT_382386 [Podospora aff. communis PSN243]|uniref:DUF967 domain protein n=1 Tax=Podospora aff. communis PSN243 TaxID=3040156 RepID=A0AAV9GKN8_9PEZI|nr:hypothetical protein QBC34DRAFT_382386 [Podospora aff. communis PSN243]
MASTTTQKVWFRRDVDGPAPTHDGSLIPIPPPTTDLEALKADGDSFTLNSFTADDAWDLGHLLHARLKPLAARGQSTLISISLANSGQVVFQCVTGPGITPDHETWARRKRNAVLRWTKSTWHLSLEFKHDEQRFKQVFQLSEEQASQYAIHGGAVPIRVRGVEGIVAVVIVSGLAQHEDHGVIVDVIKQNWEERDV